ncbi:hypothetical protein I3843_12G041100 [Carya illinoinensis]|nr:hypothetical protein I3843_12G041100 [Carya illinoinensis]
MDAEEIASSIRGKLFQTDQLPPSSQHRRSIFRVPNMLRRHNEKAFMPEVVSIGPFHHGNKQLQAVENYNKLKYLICLLRRTGTAELECLVKAIDRIEEDCRKYYAEEVDLSRKEFIEMMVIDGCFILEFLYRYQQKWRGTQGKDDPGFKTSWMPRKIIADLLLLENQLPWCVLDCLFNLMPSLKTTEKGCSRLDDLVFSYFSEYKMFPAPNSGRSHEKHAHLLDWFRNCLVGSCTVKRRNCSEASEWKPVKPVTELILHGIIPLKAKSRDNILDVKFKNGSMEIPEIVIRGKRRICV